MLTSDCPQEGSKLRQWIWAWEGGSTWYLGNTPGSWETAEERQWMERGSGDCRTLPCSVGEQLKTLEERHGRLAWETGTFAVGLDI